ncbi:MAG: CPBP family intramembrane glutamic endopeptidase [Actinomycetota bacterium]
MDNGHTKNLGYGAFAALVVAYLLIVQVLALVLSTGSDVGYGEFPDIDIIVRSMVIPIVIAIAIVVAVISWLGWWRDIAVERPTVAPWVWIVPVLLVLGGLGVMDWSNLGEQDLDLILVVVFASLLVGVGEELLFRGVSIQVLRRHGLTETKVALWSSLIFGGVHITNAISTGPKAIFQVLVVCFAGYFFYLTYRVSGTIIAPILMHAFWDFAQFSHTVGVDDPQPSPQQLLPFVALIIAGIVVYRRRDRIEVAEAPQTAAST